jgi:hypothetical protein
MRRPLLPAFMGLALSAAACDDAGSQASTAAPAFELEGTWTSEFGEETITATTWTGYVAQSVVRFDNDTNTAILQNPADAEYGPNTFSRVVWVGPEADAFHYCVVAYDKATSAEAEGATEDGIDRGDLDEKGCAGFPWSFLTRKAE